MALGKLQVLPEDFAKHIAPMVGFRNILIQEYLEVDLLEVHRVLTGHLDDFIRFASYVQALLEKHEQEREKTPRNSG